MFKGLFRKRGARPGSADESALDATTVSLTTTVPRPPTEALDRRALDLLPIAKLTGHHTQTLCRIRGLSAGGVAAEAAVDLPVGAEVHLEFNSLHKVKGRIVWVRAGAVGVKFDESVNIRNLLADKPTREGQQPRPPRLDIKCGARIRIAGYYHTVEVHDISLGGLKVELRDPDVVGQTALVTIDSLRPLKGTVRWYRDGMAGILFDKPLRFEELTGWLAERYDLASNKAGAWQGRVRRA